MPFIEILSPLPTSKDSIFNKIVVLSIFSPFHLFSRTALTTARRVGHFSAVFGCLGSCVALLRFKVAIFVKLNYLELFSDHFRGILLFDFGVSSLFNHLLEST